MDGSEEKVQWAQSDKTQLWYGEYCQTCPEWMGTSPSGPVLDQSIPHKGAKHGYGDHSRKGDANWLPKAPSLRTLPVDREGIFNMGPSKSIVINNRSNGEDVGQKLRPEPGPIAHLHKRPPPSVKGKKILAKGNYPKSDMNITAAPQWSFSFANPNTFSSINTTPLNLVLSHFPSPTFEFTASTKNGSDHQKGRSATQVSVDRQVDPSNFVKLDSSDGQQHVKCVGNGEEGAGVQSDLGSREGSEHEKVGDEFMVSEEGGGAPPTE